MSGEFGSGGEQGQGSGSFNVNSVGDMTLMRLMRDGGAGSTDQRAASEFVERYLQKLLSLIERNTASRYQSRFDADDVAQSVLMSWVGDVRQGSIHPSCEDEIWKLLSVIALCKVRNRIRFHDAAKRGVGKTASGSQLPFVTAEPGDQDAVEFSETLEALGNSLPERAARVLQLILDGHSVSDIAEELQVSTKSIQRDKKLIGRQLMALLPDDLLEGLEVDEALFD